MEDEQAVTAAEREYQARLLTLHDARARLNAATAHLRRQQLDKRLSGTATESKGAELRHQIEALTALVGQLRANAEAQRQLLRRLTDADYEPLEIAEAERADGHFEQPPFREEP